MKNALRTIALTTFVGIAVGALAAGMGQPTTGNHPKAQREQAGRRPENYIEREVRHVLLMLPFYSVFDNLAFKVDGYRVELFGQVVRPTLKSDAEAAVNKIEGVESVVNKIEVLPLSPEDDRIRVAEYRAIYGNPVLNRYAFQAIPPIHIIVKNGHVTLEGVVANEMEKNVAYVQASSVPGVFSVTNSLRVENSGDLPKR